MQQKAAEEPGNKDMSDIKGLQVGRESGQYHQAHEGSIPIELTSGRMGGAKGLEPGPSFFRQLLNFPTSGCALWPPTICMPPPPLQMGSLKGCK